MFYPDNRAFFEDLNQPGGTRPVLAIPFVPDSDIAPIWNPEAFFTVMVVNGVSWPTLNVAQALYRFRFLNGCTSRFLILRTRAPRRVPFYQIGAEQGFLPEVTELRELLMGPAERADVIMDFRELPDGTEFYLINVGPDEPFGGGTPSADGCNPENDVNCFPSADPDTTYQVMKFVVDANLNGASPTDPGSKWEATDPQYLKLNAEKPLKGKVKVTRRVSLNELESEEVCVQDINDNIVVIPNIPFDPDDPSVFLEACAGAGGEPFGPKEALLGIVGNDDEGPYGIPLKWTDTTGAGKDIVFKLRNGKWASVNVTENPAKNSIENWEIYNFTADAHPIHLHLVRFEVIGRKLIDGGRSPNVPDGVEPWETGFKDTVIAYPGEITTVRAKFDIEGLYVWHCHIVEHEDNEMMRPYYVGKGIKPPKNWKPPVWKPPVWKQPVRKPQWMRKTWMGKKW